MSLRLIGRRGNVGRDMSRIASSLHVSRHFSSEIMYSIEGANVILQSPIDIRMPGTDRRIGPTPSLRCQMQELHTVAYGIEARGEEKRCMGAKETDSLALPSSPPFYSPQKNYIKPNKLFPPRDV